MSLLLTAHLIAALIWVGGMFFSYIALRPVLASIDTLLKLQIWSQTFQRFFPWIWLSIITLLVTGFSMIVQYGGMAEVTLPVHIMLTLGIIMMLLFMHLFFAPYKRLHRAVSQQDTALGSAALNQIRLLIAINLSIGIVVTISGVLSRFF